MYSIHVRLILSAVGFCARLKYDDDFPSPGMESAFVLRLFSAGRHVSAAVPKWNTSSSWVMTRRLDTSHAALMERQRLIGVLTLSLPVCVCFQASAPLGFTAIFPAACSCVSTQEVDPRLYTGIWHQVWIFWSRWAVTGVRGEASTSDLITGWSCFHRTGRMSVEAHLFFLFGRLKSGVKDRPDLLQWVWSLVEWSLSELTLVHLVLKQDASRPTWDKSKRLTLHPSAPLVTLVMANCGRVLFLEALCILGANNYLDDEGVRTRGVCLFYVILTKIMNSNINHC